MQEYVIHLEDYITDQAHGKMENMQNKQIRHQREKVAYFRNHKLDKEKTHDDSPPPEYFEKARQLNNASSTKFVPLYDTKHEVVSRYGQKEQEPVGKFKKHLEILETKHDLQLPDVKLLSHLHIAQNIELMKMFTKMYEKA